MKTQFVSQEIALELKQLGFDKPCCAYYDGAGYVMIKEMVHCVISAPTFAQAFRFFREKYGLLSFIDMDVYSYYRFTIYEGKGISVAPHRTYEEAELECLKKLIEIVINK